MSIFGCFGKAKKVPNEVPNEVPKKVPNEVPKKNLKQVCTAAPVKATVAAYQSNMAIHEQKTAEYETWHILFLHANNIEDSNALAEEQARLKILSDPTSLASQYRPNQPGTEHGPGTRAHIAWMQAQGLCKTYPD